MPISTDKLADDIDAIRSDLADLRKETNAGLDSLRAGLESQRKETNAGFESQRKEMTAGFDMIRSEMTKIHEYQGEAKVIFGLLRWIGGALVVAVTTQAAAVIWYAAKLDSRIGYHDQRIEKLEKAAELKPARPN